MVFSSYTACPRATAIPAGADLQPGLSLSGLGLLGCGPCGPCGPLWTLWAFHLALRLRIWPAPHITGQRGCKMDPALLLKAPKGLLKSPDEVSELMLAGLQAWEQNHCHLGRLGHLGLLHCLVRLLVWRRSRCRRPGLQSLPQIFSLHRTNPLVQP